MRTTPHTRVRSFARERFISAETPAHQDQFDRREPSRTRAGTIASRPDTSTGLPVEERDEVAVEIERRELPRTEVGVRNAVNRNRVQHIVVS